MIVIGLTGSIGMGKSTTVRMFRMARIPVFDADAYVHRALRSGGRGVAAVAAAFPAAYDRTTGSINRPKLGQLVFGNPVARKKLEAILHPIVRSAEQRFINRMRSNRAPMAVLDIPLLFETGADILCDVVICVTAPSFIQRARVLARPHMTPEKLDRILAVQMSDWEKRLRADFVLNTGHGRAKTWHDLQDILRHVRMAHARNRS